MCVYNNNTVNICEAIAAATDPCNDKAIIAATGCRDDRTADSHRLYTPCFIKKTVPFVISLYLFFYKDKFHENTLSTQEVLVIMSIK